MTDQNSAGARPAAPLDPDARRQELLRRRLAKARAAKEAQQSGAAAPARGGVPRRPEGAPALLSSAQRRMWFLAQYEPDSAAYHIPLALHLDGEPDTAALAAALADVLARHDVLRTVYRTVDGDVRPELLDAAGTVLTTADVPADEVERRLADEARRPFDLAADLPLRAVLLRSGGSSVLSLVLHHIAADGWSIGVLFADLATAYAARLEGREPAFDPLPVQYADVAHWQQTGLAEELARQEAWWRERLGGATATVTVPTDRPRPAVAGTRGERITADFGAERSARVRSLAERTGSTTYMVLLAALQTVLSRYTGAEDVVVGTPVAGRTRSETEPLVGCFVNTLAMRTDLSGDPTVRQLLERVQEGTLGAFGHQDLPFERLVDALGLERELAHTPLFQVMLNVHNQAEATVRLPGLKADWRPVGTDTAKFDLSVAVVDQGGDLTADLVWRSELYDEATVRRVFGHLTTVLDAMAEDLDRPLAELPLLTPAEERLLTEWDDTVRGWDLGDTLHGLVEEQARRTPDAPAVRGADGVLDYAGLDGRANALALRLRALGVGPDRPVGLLMERSAALVVGMLGILKAGGAYLPLDPVYPDERIRALLASAGAAAVVTTEDLAGRLDAATPVVVPDGSTAARGPEVDVRPEHLCYLIFTSGSTGAPKGVAVEHRNYLNYLHGLRERIGGDQQGWNWALVSTFAADLGTTNVFGALTGGGCLHLLTRDQATDPEAFAAYAAEHRIDAMKLVPSHLEGLAAHGAGLGGILPGRLLICAGEALRPDLVARIRAARPDLLLHNHYGPTETTVSMLGAPVPADLGDAATAPLGRPFGNVGAHVLDARQRCVPVGVPGELYVSGGGVARGYLGRDDLTAERFTQVRGRRCYRTGDLVRRRPDGAIEFLGRVDHQVKIRGFRVEIGEVEAELTGRPEVREAVVVARGEGAARNLVGYLVPADPAAAPDPGELRAALRSRLPDYMVPAALVVLDALPLNANGKVDRAALPEPVAVQPASGGGELATATEHEVAAAYRSVLAADGIGAADDFFALGGDSFSAVHAVRLIGRGLSVIDLFQHPTVRELAALLDARAGGTADEGPRTLLHKLTRGNAPAGLNVVCVPYGGGSPITFQPLADALPAGHRLYAVELPGHDPSRPDDELAELESLADRLTEQITERIDGPVLLYGHCLGGALATALGSRLEAAGVELRGVALGGTFPAARLPGRFAEWMAKRLPGDRMLSNRSYLDYLRAMGGFTDVYDQAEQDFLVRALRHDVRQAEEFYTRAYGDARPAPIAAPILCVVGEKDRATQLYEERYAEWEHFGDTVDLAVIPRAGHYFLKHQADELARVISEFGATGAVAEQVAAKRPAARADLSTFAKVAIGQFVSMIGTSLSTFALGVWVYQRTGSAFDFAMISVVAVLPAVLLLPIAGAVADRVDRRRIMIVTDTVAAAGMLSLGLLLWADLLEVWHIYVVACIGAVCSAFQRPAYLAAITQLVPKRYLGQANGLAQLGTGAGDMMAVLAGGVLVSLIGLHGVVLFDMATFLTGVTCLLLVRFPDAMFDKQEEPLLREVVTGWRYIVRRHSLVAMVVFFVVFNYLFAVATVLITPMVLAGGSAVQLGVVTAVGGVGAMTGALVMALWGGTRRRAVGMIGFTSVVGLAAVVAGSRPQAAVTACGLFVLWAALMILNSHWMALIQTKVGMELQGRVLATNQMLAMSMMPLGFLTAGPLSDHVFEPLMRPGGALADSVGMVLGTGPGRGAGLLLVLVGLVLAVWGLLGLAYRPLRLIEDLLPDALPDAEIGDKDAIQAEADRLLALAEAARSGGADAVVPGARPAPAADRSENRVPAGAGR
ncbi:non-ribosomal peptide synthetase/MFS transporter [Kitasatospora sp. A2-31]|uniref:non-ribosomal peptide synthetase/MFS transporter n=1 Tax=Kitasatospora sp. A2-31 TaxID=2916414 RepID=UPI001EEC40AF|nr:non-ribosomal peptide synthetase/MFS transporter [Kitasatospora sp. A2-31]MCG6493855.1 amino acid adenylation domain-containing protein [Kitasatospora sp. A2-31]